MKPELQFSVICDDVRQEKNGKFMFIGVFNTVSGVSFPVVHPVLHIVNQWCSGEGTFRQQSRIIDMENKLVVASPEITFQLKDFYSSHFVISRFQGVVLPCAGQYSVEVLLEGELFRRFPFHILQIQKPQTE